MKPKPSASSKRRPMSIEREALLRFLSGKGASIWYLRHADIEDVTIYITYPTLDGVIRREIVPHHLFEKIKSQGLIKDATIPGSNWTRWVKA